jgi:protoporphyrinogen oxidase
MSLYVEIGMEKNQTVREEYLLNKVLEDLVRVGVITNHKLVDHLMIVMNPAYVHITKQSKEIYDTWCKKNNPDGLFSVGRYGSWTYSSIEDNILQSKELSIRLV